MLLSCSAQIADECSFVSQPMGTRLKDQVAVVTGAGAGIGRETAMLFAREGASVVCVDLKPEDGECFCN